MFIFCARYNFRRRCRHRRLRTGAFCYSIDDDVDEAIGAGSIGAVCAMNEKRCAAASIAFVHFASKLKQRFRRRRNAAFRPCEIVKLRHGSRLVCFRVL